MNEIVKTKADLCTGCNRCVRECPMETANITYQDEAGKIKVKIDHEKCIACGRCILVCKHDSRYFLDDTERFFSDLREGIPISLITAPSIRTNIPDYKKLFSYLKKLGVKGIYDVSLGADICIWASIRSIDKSGAARIISQPCPVIVSYCEIYRHDLLGRLSPVHGPMACTSIYMKKYLNVNDRIAALCPCLAKTNEFSDTHLAQYNITFIKMLDYLKENNIELPAEETGFDHDESGLGSLFPMPGGLKENMEYHMGKKLHVAVAEGFNVYEKLDKYTETPDEFLPEIFDVLNCIEGCNMGPACSHDRNFFEIDTMMNTKRKEITEEHRKEYYESVYKKYDDTFDLSHFKREYHPVAASFPLITDADISKAFELLGKTDDEKQNVDCGACGNETCHNMARKIALGVNIPINCMVKSMEDARLEHENTILAQKQLTEMEKIHETDDRVRIMLDATPLSAHFWDKNLKIIDCNQAAANLFNISDKQEYIDKYFELTPEFQPDGRRSIDKLKFYIDKTYEEGYQQIEWMRRSLNGEPIPVELTLVRVKFKGRYLVAGYCRDLREHKRMMRELAASNRQNEIQLAKLHLVVKATKIGLWDMNIEEADPLNPLNPIMWSDEFRNLLGYTDEGDFPNRISSFLGCLHPDDKKIIVDAFKGHLLDTTGNTRYDIECRLKKKNGEYAYFRTSGETTRDGDGRPIHTAGALLDVTEARNLINETHKQWMEAEASNKAKSVFLSTMSHEIRTPMNAILGITEIQLQNDDLDPDVKEALAKISSSGDLLLGIINDILDFSKIEAGKLELMINKYEIASLISDTAQLNIMHIGSKPIKFDLRVDENIPVSLLGDELRVKQILNNLLSNAFKYTTAGTVRMTVSSEAKAGNDIEVTLVFSISDTGQGMTEGQKANLFKEYSRFNMAANRSTEGTGLGMSITQKLIRLMNGEISVESEPGKGSTFTVRLPQGRASAALLGRKSAKNLRQFRMSSKSQMKRVQISRELMPYGSVLVVDDVETNIYVAKGLLSPYKLNIDSAGSGLEAIEKIKSGRVYDVIFMDHMMPIMDGIEAANIIRGMGYEYPIVALTANAVAGQLEIFLKNGFNDYVSKPIDIRQLNIVLNKLVRDRQPPEVIEAARLQADAQNRQSPGAAPQQAVDPLVTGIFVRDARKALAALEEILEKNDFANEENMRAFIINVHGIKSALANIGKKRLSAAAAKLETAGREGKSDILISGMPAFLDSLRALVEKMEPQQKTDGDGKVNEDKPYLKKMLSAIKTACEEYDETAADNALADLGKTTWPHETRELLDTIAEQLLHSDFDEIVKSVNAFIRTLD